jgi:uncharacterized protein (DUF885 family)
MRKSKYLIFLISVLIIIVSGCSGKLLAFDAFMDQLFVELITSPLDANFLVKDLEEYGFQDLEVTPLSFSETEAASHYQFLREKKNYLEKYRLRHLSPEQQLTFDVVLDYLDMNLSFEPYFYYETPLGSYLGYQAQLPLILAEYHFYTRRDIDNYLEYLQVTQASFANIITFEKERITRGLGMNDFMLEGIIEQCEDLLSSGDDYLLSAFNDKIEAVEFLSVEEKAAYRNLNQKYLEEDFLPAYRYLAGELRKLKGKADNNRGIVYFPEGQKYYQVLLRQATGTAMTADAAYDYLEDQFNQDIRAFQTLLQRNFDLFDQLESMEIFASYSYQETFAFYRDRYGQDFPVIGDVNVAIENIHQSLEENSSPAMYLLSPIDASVREVIYVNEKLFAEDSAYAFFTLAHEGIPGHLLQHLILKNSDLPKIRKILNYPSYAEGWATYVETYVGKYTALSPDVLAAYHLNNRLVYTFMCMADIGINYFGWTLAQFSEEFRATIANLSAEEIETYYYRLIEIATNYLEYYFAYFQLIDLKEEFFRQARLLGLSTSDLAFHTFYLNAGPAPFPILKRAISRYLEQ